MRSKLFAVGLIGLLSLVSPSAASAHGDVTQAVPAADSKILEAPTEVSIELD